MKKASQKGADELRSEYKRSDFGKLVRGKYAARLAAETNVVMLEPDIAKAFPNDAAVNEALRGLLEVAKTTARLTRRATRTLKLPRKSRHLDLTREEVSDAESRAEEN